MQNLFYFRIEIKCFIFPKLQQNKFNEFSEKQSHKFQRNLAIIFGKSKVWMKKIFKQKLFSSWNFLWHCFSFRLKCFWLECFFKFDLCHAMASATNHQNQKFVIHQKNVIGDDNQSGCIAIFFSFWSAGNGRKTENMP